jgi:hypothetical protein
MKSMSIDTNFMELVQLHERSWGMEQYPGRPSLSEVLSSPVVVMWTGEIKSAVYPSRRVSESQNVPSRFMFSAHKHVDELNEVLLNMIMSSKATPSTSRRLMRIFLNQKPIKIKGLRLLITE